MISSLDLLSCCVCLQASALLEEENGNTALARELLEKGSQVDPWHIPIWQAWGVLEFRAGNIDRARALFQEVSTLELHRWSRRTLTQASSFEAGLGISQFS